MHLHYLQVALKLLPDSVTFMTILMAKDETYDNLKEEMQTLTSLLVPFLEEIHSILVSFYLCYLYMIADITHF